MGAWGYKTFDDDDASDWLDGLEKSEDFSVIERTLDTITESADYLEAPECSNALAAAEVVAALLGRPSDGLPEEITRWIVGRATPTNALVAQARQAIQRVMASSELRELWDESDVSRHWREANSDLLKRLVQP